MPGAPIPTSPAGVPTGRFSLPVAPPATGDPSSLLGKPALLLREGFRGRKGRAGTEITDVGRGWSPNRPSTWSEGKGCFVIFGLNFQRQNRKCPLGLGGPGRNGLSLLSEGDFPWALNCALSGI